MPRATTRNDAPIGIFDSGIGGLSVLRHIRAQLPHENLIYFADSAHAPYGDKPEQAIVARTLAIAQFLLLRRCKALVVACNTATAAGVRQLREQYPALPIVGVEPGLNPATALTKSRRVGVMATDRTIASDKFQALRDKLTASTGVLFISQACTGLADQIEKGELDSEATKSLVRRCIAPLADSGVDTLVLGCTHYPFVQTLIEDVALQMGLTQLTIIDTGEPVARQLVRLLEQNDLLRDGTTDGRLHAFTSGNPLPLQTAFGDLLRLQPAIEQIAV